MLKGLMVQTRGLGFVGRAVYAFEGSFREWCQGLISFGYITVPTV